MPMYPISGHWGTFTLRDLVDEVCRPLTSRLKLQDIRIIIDIPTGQTVAADRELLRRAVRNLVLNAVEAMPNGGSLVATSAATAGTVDLEIADTGATLSDEERQQAFELVPSAQRNGTGWGLAVVHRIAELLGGTVTAANCPEGGAAFTLRIPRRIALEAAA